MNPDLDFEFYLDYLPYLYEICAELGYFNADGRFKNNDFEIKRVRRAIELYCYDNDISFETYFEELVKEYKQKYAARMKELGKYTTSKKVQDWLDKLESSYPSYYYDSYIPYDPWNDEEGYDLSPHADDPQRSDESDCSNSDDDWDGPKY
jgi:hypothetical protein